MQNKHYLVSFERGWYDNSESANKKFQTIKTKKL